MIGRGGKGLRIMTVMAKIVHSEAAPSTGVVRYNLAGVGFELGGRNKSFDTDDRNVLSNAQVHPWLEVVRADVKDEAVASDEPVTTDKDKKD